MKIFVSFLFFIAFILPADAAENTVDVFERHFEAIKAEAVFFKMAHESFNDASIKQEAVDDLKVVSGKIFGHYVSDDNYGYIVEVKLSNGKIKKSYFRVSGVENPFNFLFFRRWLPESIRTVDKDRGIDPCYSNAPPYSYWYLNDQAGDLKKVETDACSGHEPFVTPEKKSDLDQLNRLRDFILVLGASEPVK